MELILDHEILVGTYEEYVLGFKTSLSPVEGVSPKKGQSPSLYLLPSFTDHAHSSTVRCLAAAGKFLVSGGSDENIKVYNLRNRRIHGDLLHHTGSVNVALFYDQHHLLTAGDDANICIVKTGTWQVEKTLCKHQDAVQDVALHPSGKLALSVGRDHKLITWNLIKGRTAYVTNVKEVADVVRWSTSGQHYAVGFYKRVDVYSVATAAIVHSVTLPGRANALAFLDDDTLLVAGDMPQIEIHSVGRKSLLSKFDAHGTRVRCLQLLHDAEMAGDDLFCLITASNDGFVKVWSLRRSGETSFDADLLASRDVSCRVTCLAVHKVPEVKLVEPSKQKKKKRQMAAATAEKEEDDDVEQVDHEVTLPKKKKKKLSFAPESDPKKEEGKSAAVVTVEETTSSTSKAEALQESENKTKRRKKKK